jgi:hypothetical protein
VNDGDVLGPVDYLVVEFPADKESPARGFAVGRSANSKRLKGRKRAYRNESQGRSVPREP